MIQRLRAMSVKLWRFLVSSFLFLFGRLDWQRPVWLEFIFRKYDNTVGPHVAAFFKKCDHWRRAHPKQIKKGGLGLAAVLVLAIGGYFYWDSLPKPRMVKAWVTAPSATPLEDHAVPYNLEVAFESSVAPLEQIGKVTTTAAVLSPKFDGVWTWASDSKLVFTPKTDWPVNQEFEVQLVKKVFPSHLRLSTYEFEFDTAKFAVTRSSAQYYQHPENPKDKRVTAELAVSHPVDPESLKNKVSIELTGNTEVLGNIPKKYAASLTYDKYFGKIMITSDIIPLPNKDTTAEIVIDDGWKSSRGGNKMGDEIKLKVDIPGMFTYFRVSQARFDFVENKKYELEQVISVETTTEVTDVDFDKSFEAFLLPEDRPAMTGDPVKRNYAWSVGDVTPEILGKSQKLKMERIPSERPQTRLHTFKIDAPANRRVFVKLNKGLKSFHEYVLAEDYQEVLMIKPFRKEIRILHEGAILAMSGDKKLSVLTRGTKAFRIEVGHVLPDQLNHLLSQTGGRFAEPQFANSYQFNWDNISEKFTEIIDVAESNSGKPEFAAFDAGKFLSKSSGPGRGIMYVRLQPYDRANKNTYGKGDSRFVLVTDLGVIAKKMADKSYEIFVQSISTGQPVGGAQVAVVGKNGLDVTTGTTDEQGRVRFPDLSDFKMEKTPLAFVVRRGNDLSFLPLNRSDRELQYSRFDVGGIHVGGDQDKLQAYVFSDRGLYRPGETVHLSSIVRSFDWKTKLEGVPLEWVVTDPKGQEFYKEKTSLKKEGFIELELATQETSFVGTYTGELYIIKDNIRQGLLGSTSFRVEEFVPDRTKISAGFSVPETSGWTKPQGLKAWVRAMNLFGFPAEDRRVEARLDVSPAAPSFPGYREYQFFFPRTDKSYNETLPQQQTNDKGEVEYEIDLSKFAKGNYRLHFEAEAFEAEGGRSVTAASSIMVSESDYFIGYRTESDLAYLKSGSNHMVSYIAVDPNLKMRAAEGLSLRLVEKQWISVLTKQPNGTFKYESVQRDREISKEPYKIDARGSSYNLPTTTAGDFKLILTNKEGVDVSYLEFSVVGEGNVLGKIDRNAELQIKLSRSDYQAGEEVEMQIRAPYVGSGIITIERDKVYAVKWFKTTANNSMQTIRVPAGLEGNAYINVTFLRDIGSKEIFMSPLSYGIVPFSVDLKRRQIQVDLKVPTDQRPGQPMKIEYRASQKSKIIVFAVNEGILQVAKYQSPDPLKVFFRKRALEIETAQLLDLVLPEYRIVKDLSASGGDGGSALSRNLNPFRRKGKPPVVFWSGIIEADTTFKSLTYNVPDDFNGSLRVMAVAVSTEAIGIARTDALVRGDFILSPTVPFVLTPGDETVVGVSVFNNLKGSGPNAKIKVSIKSSEHLEILEGATAELEIPETKEARTVIKVRAKDRLGSAQLTFQASMGAASSKVSESISLRPLTPFRTQLWGGVIKSGSEKIKIERSVYPEFAKRSVAVSNLPLSLAHGLTEYLTAFPYGCTEQLISMAMPTLILGELSDFNFKPEQREKAFRAALATLRQRQTSDGGFGLYSSYGASTSFPSLYAIHYLLEAKERGFAVPQDLQERAKAYLRGFPNQNPGKIQQARTTAYALYLLAMFGQSVGNEVNTLMKEIDSAEFKKEWSADIGSLFVASTFKLLQQDALASKHAASVKGQSDFVSDYEYYHDTYSHNAFLIYLISKHFPERLKSASDVAVDGFVRMIQKSHYNTLNSALAIMALERLARSGGTVLANAKVSEVDAAGKLTALVLPQALFPRVPFSPGAAFLEVKADSDIRVFYQAQVSGFDKPEAVREIKDKIEILREYRALGGKTAVSSLKMGDEIEVHLKIRSLDSTQHSNVAIVDLVPSGFEIVLERRAHGARMNFKKLIAPPQDEVEKSWAFYVRTPTRTAQFLRLLIEEAQAQEEGDEGEGESYPSEDVPESYSEEGSEEEGDGSGESDGPRAASDVASESSAEVPTLALPGSNLLVSFEEPREDRIVLYASIAGEVKEYIYKIKATNQGTFKTPPAFAQDLYDRSVQAQGPVGSIRVEGQ